MTRIPLRAFLWVGGTSAATASPVDRGDVGYRLLATSVVRLATSDFRDALAEAVVAALQRLYLPEHLDIPTGQFRMPALST